MLVEAFVAQFAVEAFDVTILSGLSGFDERQAYFGVLAPPEHRLGRELCAVVHHDGVGQLTFTGHASEHTRHSFTADGRVRFEC